RSLPSPVAGGAIPDTLAPSAPLDVTATLVDGLVNLSWEPSVDNVAVTGYVIHRSADALFEPGPETEIGTSPEPTVIDAVGAGLWSYRITAVDAAGNESEPSEPLSIEVPDTVPPTQPVPSIS